MDLLLYAVPFFFLAIGIELLAERIRGTNYYRVNDALTSLATGTVSQLVKVMTLLVPITFYVVVYEHFALTELGNSPVVWVIAFVLYDFFYYWNHRLGHEVNLLWAAHVVHHSSEEYNLTTALRQTGSGFLSFIFYIPMAILGFDPLMVISVGALNLIYQFWVHTQHVGKLGWYEQYFVTPSNHRAHHAQNDVYIDRNYGGVFIIWDRMFGSYQEELEEDPPIFGIRGALNTWNPIWANLQVYSQLLQDAIHTKSWWYRLTLWFRRTGWRPPDVVDTFPQYKTDLDHFDKFDTKVPTLLKIYGVIHYATFATIATVLSVAIKQIPWNEQIIIALFVALSSFSIGALLENKHYAGVLEWMRVVMLFCVAVLMPMPQALSLGLCAACVISAPLLWFGRRTIVANNSAVN